MGHQQPPRAAQRAGQFENQIADFAGYRRALMGRIEHDIGFRGAGAAQLLHDELRHHPFLAAQPRQRHHLHRQPQGFVEIGFRPGDNGDGLGFRCVALCRLISRVVLALSLT